VYLAMVTWCSWFGASCCPAGMQSWPKVRARLPSSRPGAPSPSARPERRTIEVGWRRVPTQGVVAQGVAAGGRAGGRWVGRSGGRAGGRAGGRGGRAGGRQGGRQGGRAHGDPLAPRPPVVGGESRRVMSLGECRRGGLRSSNRNWFMRMLFVQLRIALHVDEALAASRL
jgi:hypothetical protein